MLVAIGTGGASAGLAKALRQRLETLLPASLGALATALHDARGAIRARFPDLDDRRRALGTALAAGRPARSVDGVAGSARTVAGKCRRGADRLRHDHARARPIPTTSPFAQARALALADRIYHRADVPAAILDRARADAARILCTATPVEPGPGLSIYMEMA